MAEDGFHPGPRLYARVAARLAEVCGALLAGREDPRGADPTDVGRAGELVLERQSSRASAA
jgi:hypothetical protein